MRWLIDGHNLIGQMPNLRLDDPHDEEKLLEILRQYRARTGDILTVVFDSGHTYQAAKTQKRGGITVQFAPHGRTADQLIVQRLQQVKNPQAVKVVTSDRAIQQAASQAGVRVVAAHEFAQALLQSSGPSASATSEKQSDVQLSAVEVESWLELFNQRDP